MKLEEILEWKREHGYTAAQMSEHTGIPLGTLQKFLSGQTKSPRREVMEALEKLCTNPHAVRYELPPLPPPRIREDPVGYGKKLPHYTLEDYYAVPEPRRVELIDGVFYDLASPARTHQILVAWIINRFLMCMTEHGKDCVVLPSFDVQLDRDNETMVEPDLLICCDPSIVEEDRIYGAPDFVLEILSPSTRAKDLYVKLNKYHDAGVREYWIVDPKKEQVIVYRFEDIDEQDSYTFSDTVPLGISGGKCSVDFAEIKKRL